MWPTTHTTHLGNSNENVDGRKGDPYSHIFVSNPNFKMALNIVFSFWARNACAFIRELTNTNVDGREGDPQHCFIRMRVYTRMSKHKCWREKRRPSTLLKMLSYIACLNLFWATHLNLVLFRLPRKSSNDDESITRGRHWCGLATPRRAASRSGVPPAAQLQDPPTWKPFPPQCPSCVFCPNRTTVHFFQWYTCFLSRQEMARRHV